MAAPISNSMNPPVEPFYDPDWLEHPLEQQYKNRLHHAILFVERSIKFVDKILAPAAAGSELREGLECCLRTFKSLKNMLQASLDATETPDFVVEDYNAKLTSRDAGELTYLVLEALQVLGTVWKFMLEDGENAVVSSSIVRIAEAEADGVIYTPQEDELENKVKDTLRDSEACRVMPYDLTDEDSLWGQVQRFQFLHWELTQALDALRVPFHGYALAAFAAAEFAEGNGFPFN